MSTSKTRNFPLSSCRLSQSFSSELNTDEELRRFRALLFESIVDNNYELETSCRRLQIKHAAVQTVPEMDEKHYSWLLNMESKADALCVDLSNLLNTLLQAKSWDSKRRKFDHNSLSLDFILSKIGGSTTTDPIKTGLQLPMLAETISSPHFSSTPNLSFTLVLQNIENKIKSVLKKATEFRNSIPIVNTENVLETCHKSVQTVPSEPIASHRFGLKPENRMLSKVPKKDKIRDPSCAEMAVPYKMERSASHFPVMGKRNAKNFLKKQTSALDFNWKDRNFNTAKTSSNLIAKTGPATGKTLSEKNMRETGAIPKKVKDVQMVPTQPVPPLKKIGRQATEISKAKLTSQKPVWR